MMDIMKLECKCNCHELIGGYIKNCLCCELKNMYGMKNLEECECDCHHYKGIMHCMPCCFWCEVCEKYIKFWANDKHKHILENEFKNEQ
jgi:hypothetical protein